MLMLAPLALTALSASLPPGAPRPIALLESPATTPSQSESNDKQGRDLRRRQDKISRLERAYSSHTNQCMQGNEGACDQARTEYGEMQDLRVASATVQR